MRSCRRGYESGQVEFLTKPVNLAALGARLQAHVEVFRLRKTLANEVGAHRRTLRQLEAANEEIRHFAQNAAHDLRSPLHTARGFMEGSSRRERDRVWY